MGFDFLLGHLSDSHDRDIPGLIDAGLDRENGGKAKIQGLFEAPLEFATNPGSPSFDLFDSIDNSGVRDSQHSRKRGPNLTITIVLCLNPRKN